MSAPADRLPWTPRGLHPAGWLAASLLALGTVYLAGAFGLTQASLLAIGAALGVVLYHAAFGFTSAWRVFLVERRGAGLRAQMVMLAVAVALFFPALDAGTVLGNDVRGFVFPIGVSLAVGAFLFGVGMQVGGGCASGTLFTAGGGNLRMAITLLGFIFGSALATHHVDWWWRRPAFEPVSLVETLGVTGGLALSAALFAAVYLITIALEWRRHGALQRATTVTDSGWRGFLRGPWPLLWGAVGLAVLNYLTLVVAGRPWGITSAFALWGAKVFGGLGVDVGHWAYWQNPFNAAALRQSILADTTSVMNLGILLGALLAATLAGRFAPSLRIPRRPLLAAILGGILLGYGARLAYGCNIGAFFSGVASGSLHGWGWLVFGFLGNMVGVRLRPWFYGRETVGASQSAGC